MNFQLKQTDFFQIFSPKSTLSILSNLVITNSDYNKQIWLVPSMFALTEFDCILFDNSYK
jgi:hypothetical protein